MFYAENDPRFAALNGGGLRTHHPHHLHQAPRCAAGAEGAAPPQDKGARITLSERYSDLKRVAAENAKVEEATIELAEKALASGGESGLSALLAPRQHIALDMHYFALTFQRMAIFASALVIILQIADSPALCEAPVVALCVAIIGSIATHCFVHGAHDNPDRALLRLMLDILRVVAFIVALTALAVQRSRTSPATCSWGYSTLAQTIVVGGFVSLVFWIVSAVYSYVRHSTTLTSAHMEKWIEDSRLIRVMEIVVRAVFIGLGAGLFITLVKEGETSDLNNAYLTASVQAYVILDVGLSDLVRAPGGEARASASCLMLDTWLACWLTALGIWSATVVKSDYFSKTSSTVEGAIAATFVSYCIVWAIALVVLGFHWHHARRAAGSLRAAAFAHSDGEVAAVLRSNAANPVTASLVTLFSGAPFHASETKSLLQKTA
jgi:hypothetical protein